MVNVSLEQRGYRPKPHERDELAKYIYLDIVQTARRRISIELIHGNSWSGWYENGNPHGEHRPGPIAELRGILTS